METKGLQNVKNGDLVNIIAKEETLLCRYAQEGIIWKGVNIADPRRKDFNIYYSLEDFYKIFNLKENDTKITFIKNINGEEWEEFCQEVHDKKRKILHHKRNLNKLYQEIAKPVENSRSYL